MSITPFSPDIINWMKQHSTASPDKLRLKHHGDATMAAAIEQIDCRQRCRHKLPEVCATPQFRFPSTLAAQQSTSEAMARWHASLTQPTDRVLDLTCGLGIDAFSMARRVAEVTAVEIDPVKAEHALYNAGILGLDNVSVVCADARRVVEEMTESYDLIYIDPARRDGNGRRLFALRDCLPDVTGLLPRLMARTRRLVIKASPMLDITRTVAELGPDTSAIYILGTPTECRELVAVVEREKAAAAERELEICAVTLAANGRQVDFRFTLQELHKAETTLGVPREEEFLYEPWPAVMKAGATAMLSQRFGLDRLHPDTHLLCSPRLERDFPGHIYRIERVEPYNKRSAKLISRGYPQINVASRGFGMTAEELKKALRVKEGTGESKLFGVKTPDGKRMLVVGRLGL